MNGFSPRIIATAGHIDHGKSTLVEALTGTDPDRLPEEKQRGMTIELGFARLDLPDRIAPGGGWRIGVIDVPGHADFVRNMAAGVCCADAALLAVAAGDGWMPQTEEHFRILLHFGITRSVVVLTKSDLLRDADAAQREIRGMLSGTPWERAAIIPVCAISGEGLDELKTALGAMLREAPAPENAGKPRLFVDRVFSPRGVGTLVTGTLTGGTLTAGAEVFVHPSGMAAKIRGLQSHGEPVSSAGPGMRTAVRLGGVEIAKGGIGPGVWRGHVICGSAAAAAASLQVELVRLDRGPAGEGDDALPFRSGQKIWLHHGTAVHEARVSLAAGRILAAGQRGLAVLKLASPAAVCGGDRFIVRDFSRRHTLAGGIVLETESPPRAWRRRTEHLRLLAERAAHPGGVRVWVESLLQRDGFLREEGLLRQTRFAEDAITAAASSLPDVVRTSGLICRKDRWDGAMAAALAAVDSHHASRPDTAGLPLSELRRQIAPLLPDAGFFEPLAEALCQDGLIRDAGFLRRADFTPQVPLPVRQARARLRIALLREKLNPPKLSALVQTPEDQEAIRIMQRSGEIFPLDAETMMLTSAYEDLRQSVVAHLNKAGRATISALRDALGGSRRILIPCIERMDREGFTRRNGDDRMPGPRAASLVRP